MHRYFSSVEPTMQNKYTGMFKGCNFIFITAESLSHYVIDRDLTRHFTGLRTRGLFSIISITRTGGQHQRRGVCCVHRLNPESRGLELYHSGKNWLPFVMGNQFLRLGYSSRAYHNHTYTYYKRNISHRIWGIFTRVGNGLKIKTHGRNPI